MLPIVEIADSMGLDRDTVLPYGKYKAKVTLDAIREDGGRGFPGFDVGTAPFVPRNGGGRDEQGKAENNGAGDHLRRGGELQPDPGRING